VGWNLALDEGSVINPHANYAVVKVVGDAMDPTYPDGSYVLIDADIRAPSPPGVFVLRDGDGYTLQRCQVVLGSSPPMVYLLPDNPTHQKETVPVSSLDVVGMVVCGISGDADEVADVLAYIDWEIATEN
jgi:phage repressor protein C with HTH and peptisase S24 domain